MGQAHNLQPRLFNATPYFRMSVPETPANEDVDVITRRLIQRSADRGYQQRLFHTHEAARHLILT